MGFGINKIIDSKVTAFSVFGVTGFAKVVSDYNKANEEQKGFVLARDSIILGGTTLGIGLYSLAKGQLLKKNLFPKKFLTNSVNNSHINNKNNILKKKFMAGFRTFLDISKDCIDNTLMLACGIFGAIGADYGIRYSHIEQNKKLRNLNKYSDNTFNTIYNYEDKIKSNLMNSSINKNFENAVGSEVKSNIYSRMTDLRAMKMFGSTMVGIQGFDVIQEKTFKKRMKHATGCLISNSVVPLFFLSMSTRLTKNMKSLFRAPIIFASLVGGTMYTNKLINNLDKGKGILHKFENKFFKKQINKTNEKPHNITQSTEQTPV